MSAFKTEILPPLEAKYHRQENKYRGKLVAMERQDNEQSQFYVLEGNDGRKHKYALPPPESLKPYVDTVSGRLDTWPAHAAGQSYSENALAIRKSSRDAQSTEEQRTVLKPKFLDNLESFLRKELRALDCPQQGPSALRLQAHREVFEYLIEDFKTYKPLLSGIKNEYEKMLAHQREQLRELEPLKAMLVTVSEECDKKIMLIRAQEKQEIVDLKNEKGGLLRKIEEMKSDKYSLETQIDKLREELAVEYQRYKTESDARKILVQDLNELRYQHEDDSLTQAANDQTQAGQDGDPVILKIALKKARENLTETAHALNEMKANYGDVIPRRDFENLTKEFQDFRESIDVMQKDNKRLMKEMEALQLVHKQVVDQRDQFYVDLETLKRSATPRPEWAKCANYLEGGTAKWNEISAEKSSDQLVDVLLSEMTGADLSSFEHADFFQGRGLDDDVPRYLRFDGQVRNRRLGKHDTLMLIKDFWRHKVSSDSKRDDSKREPINEYLYQYLCERFGVDTVIEWGYNLIDACQRFNFDERIKEFLLMLQGEVDEDVFHQLYRDTQLLRKAIVEVSTDNETVSKLQLSNVFKKYYPLKSEQSISQLFTVAEQMSTNSDDNISIDPLFHENDQGDMSLFIQTLRAQRNSEQMMYIDEVIMSLDGMVTIAPADLKKSLMLIDPEINKDSMLSCLAWTYGTSPDKAESAETIEKDKFILRLRNSSIYRHGPKL